MAGGPLEGVGVRPGAFHSSEALFTHYFQHRSWKHGGEETVSGSGSTLAYTENLRAELPQLVADLGVKTLLDAPCGDYNWFAHVRREPPFRYIGADIVEPMVEENRRKHGSEDTRFMHLDITRGELPPADLWLLRDCLFHLSFDDIARAMRNFVAGPIPHLLTTTLPNTDKNRDIDTGDWRPINLRLSPFAFPEPRHSIADWIEGYPERYLQLWTREDVAAVMERSTGLGKYGRRE